MNPDLQHPNDALPLMDIHKLVQVIGSADQLFSLIVKRPG
jgi:hypothetical protein